MNAPSRALAWCAPIAPAVGVLLVVAAAVVGGIGFIELAFRELFPALGIGSHLRPFLALFGCLVLAVAATRLRWSPAPPPANPLRTDATKLHRIAGRHWVAAPPMKSQERGLAAATGRLHDRITVAPAWKRIVDDNHGAPIDLDGEAMDILRRLQEIGDLREKLGKPAGLRDPIRSQHKALDRSLLSVAQRIEALAEYHDQLLSLEESTAELARLERAELLHDRVLDVISEDAADPHHVVDPTDLSHRIRSTKAAIVAATQTLRTAAAALDREVLASPGVAASGKIRTQPERRS